MYNGGRFSLSQSSALFTSTLRLRAPDINQASFFFDASSSAPLLGKEQAAVPAVTRLLLLNFGVKPLVVVEMHVSLSVASFCSVEHSKRPHRIWIYIPLC